MQWKPFALGVVTLTTLASSANAQGVRVGSSSLFQLPDYTDSFTGTDDGGLAGRPYVAAGLPEYRIENSHGNPVTHFTQQAGSAFSIASDLGPGFVQGAAPAYPTVLGGNASGAGSNTGFTQTGGNGLGYGVVYGLRSEYVVQVDAVQVTDRVDITSGDVPTGSFIAATNSISVFFRGDGSGAVSVYNGAVDTTIPGADTGIAAWNDPANDAQSRWHNYAVRFDVSGNEIEIFVDEISIALVDLDTFAGGTYASGFSNGFVSVSTNTVDRTWTDNFQVGGFCTVVETFTRPDESPVTGWTEFTDLWRVEGERLVVGPTPTTAAAGEAWAWLGDPPSPTGPAVTIEFDVEWLAPGTNGAVGRHGGCAFFVDKPTWRGDAPQSGYYVDWIDRAVDRGIRFTRIDPSGVQSLLVAGQLEASTPNPPAHWKIEVDGPNIRFFGDGVPLFDVVDNTYRGGHFGFWQWAGGEHAAYDNLCITEPDVVISPCFATSSATPIIGDEVAFDASCTLSNQEISLYEWDFGDGNSAGVGGPLVQHTYVAAGEYLVRLRVMAASGTSKTLERTVTIFGKTLSFCDEFERVDGAVDGWTVAQGGTWRLEGGELRAGPSGPEHWIWAGSPPVIAPGVATFEFDHSFLAPGTNGAVGRHGGFQFHVTNPSTRATSNFSGYFIDWIDRAADRGIRLTRATNAAQTVLVAGQGAAAPAEPPSRWRVETDGSGIRVYGDDVLYIDHPDTTYRGGFYGLWTWEAGQEVAIDDFCLAGDNLSPCFDVSECGIAGLPVGFDAGCSDLFDASAETIVSYAWDFGDGTQGEGEIVEHTYPAGDTYVVTLVVETDLGNSATASVSVSVGDAAVPLRECFDAPPGDPSGWTVSSGAWEITAEGTLSTDTIASGGEAFIWAGAPPAILPAELVAELDWNFLEGQVAGVGRHGAVHFFWNEPTANRFDSASSGYALFYIDRASDRGLTLMRFDGAALTTLNPPGGTPEIPDPPAHVRIEVMGPTIRVYADDVLAIEAEDDTYRCGHFGLWAYLLNRVEFDNVSVLSPMGETEPTCDLALACELLEGDEPKLRVSGSVSVPSTCGPAADACDCSTVEAFLDGIPLGAFDLGGGSFVVDLDLPEDCEPGSEHVLSARCLSESGAGAEGSCTFVCPQTGGFQIPGDCNQDAELDLSDAVCLLEFLFTARRTSLPCGDGSKTDPGNVLLMDGDANGELVITDAVRILEWLYVGGPPHAGGTECVTLLGCPSACSR